MSQKPTGLLRPEPTTDPTDRPLTVRDCELLALLCFQHSREIPESSAFWSAMGQRALNTAATMRGLEKIGGVQ